MGAELGPHLLPERSGNDKDTSTDGTFFIANRSRHYGFPRHQNEGWYRVLSIAIVLAALTAVLGVHPFVTYPLSLLAMRKRTVPQMAKPAENIDFSPSVAICMSAFNEAKVIAAKMDSLLDMAASYPGRATVHVYVDGPTDDTAGILADYAGRADILFGTDRRGKTWGMNQLVLRTDSELVLFTDANVVSETDALVQLTAPFADASIGLASARLRYNNPNESATSRSGAIYWEIEEGIKRIESETIGLAGVDGAMFMVRRSAHRAPPPHLIDDFYISLSVLITGLRVISVENVEVCERSAVLAGEEFMRKRRIACQSWNVHRALWPQLRRMPAARLYGYISHRVLKWLAPYFLALFLIALGVIAATVFGPARAGLAAAIGLALFLLASALHMRPATMVTSVLYSLFGVAFGPIESLLFHKTYTVWLPANSVRETATDSQTTAQPDLQ